MPMRVGFAEFRRQMLERDLEAIEEMIPILGVEKVILTGDMAAEDYSPDTKIELVIVHNTEYSFGRRRRFLLVPPAKFSGHRHAGLHAGGI